MGITDNDEGYGRYETKRLWQWKVGFYATDTDSKLATLLSAANVRPSMTIAAKTVSRPTVTFNEVVVNHANESWKLAGKTNWASDNIEVVFNDIIPKSLSGAGDVDPHYSVAGIMYEWQNLIQSATSGAAALSADYKSNIVVVQYAPDATVVERILYSGAWPNSVSGDGWDYTSEEGSTITASFTFDKFYRLEKDGSANTPPTNYTTISDEV